MVIKLATTVCQAFPRRQNRGLTRPPAPTYLLRATLFLLCPVTDDFPPVPICGDKGPNMRKLHQILTLGRRRNRQNLHYEKRTRLHGIERNFHSRPGVGITGRRHGGRWWRRRLWSRSSR